jgi:hypothetical protein
MISGEMGTFQDRVDELIERVGTGRLQGKLEVDQIYAHFQHEDLRLKHPRGGSAKYLEQPLFSNAQSYLEWLARFTLEPEGPKTGMEYAMEHLSGQVEMHAPVEFAHLRHSGHPTVQDEEQVVYDRPPIARRLTEEEIKRLYHAHVF